MPAIVEYRAQLDVGLHYSLTLRLNDTVTMLYCWLLLLLLLLFVISVVGSLSPDSVQTICFVERWSTKQGFHRSLHTDVVVPDLSLDGCSIALVESLPAGMYADLDQLKDEAQLTGLQVYAPVDMDIEKPEYASPPHSLYVFGTLDSGATTSEGSLQWTVEMSFHLRYHRPQLDHDTVQVSLTSPQVLLKCSESEEGESSGETGETVTAPCPQHHHRNCSWRELLCDQGQTVKFAVPVGRQEHQFVVVCGTLLVTVAATVFLAVVILRTDLNNSPQTDRGKKHR